MTVRWKPKVNRTCAYQLQKTVTNPLGQVTVNYVKRRPAVITGFATDTNPILRVRHSGETYGTAGVGVPRQLDPTTPVLVGAFTPSRAAGAAARPGKYVSL